MKITSNFKKAAKIALDLYGEDLVLVVSKTQKYNTQALAVCGNVKDLNSLENGTEINTGKIGIFRKIKLNEIKYQDLMSFLR